MRAQECSQYAIEIRLFYLGEFAYVDDKSNVSISARLTRTQLYRSIDLLVGEGTTCLGVSGQVSQ